MLARRAAPLAAVVLVVLVASACSRLQLDDGVQVEATPAAVGDAAARTVAATTGAYRAIYTYTVEPSDHPGAAALDGIEVEVDGRFDQESGLRTATLDPDSETGVGAGEVGTLDVVADPEAGVLHVQDGRDGPWTPVTFAEAPPTPGGVRHAAADVLVLLALAGTGQSEVTAAGRADLGGVETVVLQLERPLGEAVRGDDDLVALQPIVGDGRIGSLLDTTVAFELFVDRDRVVRRVVATFDLLPFVLAAGIPAESATERVQVDLFDLGASAPVTLPEAPET